MTLREALTKGATPLRNFLSATDAWAEAEILLAFVLKKPRAFLLAHDTGVLTVSALKKFDALLARRMKREPVAYLIQSADFFKRNFFVDPRVLIPRPETEDMIEHTLAWIHPHDLVVDIGTGSGALAVTMAKERADVSVIGSDVSAGALAIAKKNAKTLGAQVTWLQASLLSPALQKKMSASSAKNLVVLANLPYIPLKDKKDVMKDVKDFEPGSALFVRGDGSALIQQLLKQLAVFIKKDQRPLFFMLECDPSHIKLLAKLAHTFFPKATITIVKDFRCHYRFLEIKTGS